MKMAKKFLAVALAGVLALSVLTGCGNSVKSSSRPMMNDACIFYKPFIKNRTET